MPASKAGRRVGAVVAVSLLSTACGPTVRTTQTTPPPTASTTVTALPLPPTTAAPTATTTIATTLAIGEWEGQLVAEGPRNGDALLVVGVRFNDVLNVREGPGQEFSVVTTAPPAAPGVASLGLTWAIAGTSWYAIDIGGVQGWASSSFLSIQAGTFDFTSRVAEKLGEVPESGSLIGLGMTVARSLASEDPPSTIEQPTEAVVGDQGEIHVDVVGVGDDSVAGYRLQAIADDDGTWRLTTVEATVLCERAVDGDLCA